MNAGRIFLLSMILWVMSHGIYKIYEYFKPAISQNLLTIQGVVVDIPERLSYGTSFMFKTNEGVLKLNWYQQKLMLIPGQKWQLHIKLKTSFYFANPGEFNYREYLRKQGVQALGYVLDDPENKYLGFSWYAAPLDYLRFCWYQKLLTSMADLKEKSILFALIFGDKTLLNASDWQSFERTGTSYFMVISGLHIVLFAALGMIAACYVWSLIPRLTLIIPAPKIGLIIGLMLGLTYGLMAGALVPTQRAVLMLLLVGLAKLCIRSISSIRALITAFILILAWNPLVIVSVAFWMSFIAVFFLIFCFSGRLGKLKVWQEWIMPQWLMFWSLLPLMIYVFNQCSLISIITNLISMPIMIFGVIPMALIGAFLILLLPSLGGLCLQLSNFLMLKLLTLLHYAAFKLWWGTYLAQISFINMLFGIFGVLVIFLPKGIPGRYLGWFMLIPVVFPIVNTIHEKEVRINTLMTQNGPVTIIATAHHTLLQQNINHLNAAHADLKHIIQAYCIHEGIKQIDLWLINMHGNYHNAVKLMHDMPKLELKKIALNHKFKIYDSRMVFCGEIKPWVWDGVKFSFNKTSNSVCALNFAKAT